jgi:hypothetical protein
MSGESPKPEPAISYTLKLPAPMGVPPEWTMLKESWYVSPEGQDYKLATTGIFLADLELPEINQARPLLLTAIVQRQRRSWFNPYYFFATASSGPMPTNMDAFGLLPEGRDDWITVREYLTDEWLDIWTNEAHVGFAIAGGNREKIRLNCRGTMKVGSLNIRQISTDQLPDVHEYLDHYAKMKSTSSGQPLIFPAELRSYERNPVPAEP